MTDSSAQSPTPRRLAGQGALLFSGFSIAQGLALLRNALIGHTLSLGDFGIAATITLVLQIVETLSDLGSERLIVQAEDGDTPEFLAASHAMLVLRGVVLSGFLLLCGPLLAQFFEVPHAIYAFRLIALVPLIKGFMHLDCRRAQRHFNNRPQVIFEVVPQLLALLLALPVLAYSPTYSAVADLAIVQALVATIFSHGLAQRAYHLKFDRPLLKRQLEFGWPILLSALPLVAVYQGDRVIIGRMVGMEALAGYSAVFMLTMVPGLVAARVGHSLMLPLFSETLRRGHKLYRRYTATVEMTVVLAALYFCVFAVAGEFIVPLVFGANYANLGHVTTALAFMWALRMIQAVPGMALLAYGTTKPFVVAGIIRALALPFVFVAALNGTKLAGLAAVGCAFEFFSLVYVAMRLEKSEYGLGAILVKRALFLVPTALVAILAQNLVADHMGLAALSTVLIALAVASVGASTMPLVRAHVRKLLAGTRAAPVV